MCRFANTRDYYSESSRYREVNCNWIIILLSKPSIFINCNSCCIHSQGRTPDKSKNLWKALSESKLPNMVKDKYRFLNYTCIWNWKQRRLAEWDRYFFCTLCLLSRFWYVQKKKLPPKLLFFSVIEGVLNFTQNVIRRSYVFQ